MSLRSMNHLEIADHPLETESHDPFHPLHHLPGISDDYFELSERELIEKLHILRLEHQQDIKIANLDPIERDYNTNNSLLPELDLLSMSSSEDDPRLFFAPQQNYSNGTIDKSRNQNKHKKENGDRQIFLHLDNENSMKEMTTDTATSQSSPKGINNFPSECQGLVYDGIKKNRCSMQQELQSSNHQRTQLSQKNDKAALRSPPSSTEKQWEGREIILQQSQKTINSGGEQHMQSLKADQKHMVDSQEEISDSHNDRFKMQSQSFFDFNSLIFQENDPFDQVAYKLNRIPSFSSSCDSQSDCNGINCEAEKIAEEEKLQLIIDPSCRSKKETFTCTSDERSVTTPREALNERRLEKKGKKKLNKSIQKSGKLYIKLADAQDFIDYTSASNFSVKGELLFNRLLRERARIELKKHMLDDSAELYVDVHCDKLDVEHDATMNRIVESTENRHGENMIDERFSSDGTIGSYTGNHSRASAFSVDKDKSVLFVI